MNTKLLLKGWGRCGIAVSKADNTYTLAATASAAARPGVAATASAARALFGLRSAPYKTGAAARDAWPAHGSEPLARAPFLASA